MEFGGNVFVQMKEKKLRSQSKIRGCSKKIVWVYPNFHLQQETCGAKDNNTQTKQAGEPASLPQTTETESNRLHRLIQQV